MTLINISTQQIISLSQLQQMWPNVSFPADISTMTVTQLSAFGVAPLTYTTQPSSQFYTVAMGPFTENADGTYSTTWIQTAISLTQAQSIQLTNLTNYTQTAAYADITYNGATIGTNATVGVIMAHVAAGTQTITYLGDNGVFIQVAPSDAAAIQTMMATQIGLAYATCQQLTNQINALTDTADVAAYSIATNWATVEAAIVASQQS
jgi:hypothetical protein